VDKDGRKTGIAGYADPVNRSKGGDETLAVHNIPDVHDNRGDALEALRIC
jgi:hypothetical protein